MNINLEYLSVSILFLMVVECILTILIVYYLLILLQSYLIYSSLSYMPTYLPLYIFDNLSETVYFMDKLYGDFIYSYFCFVGFSLLKIFTVYILLIYYGCMLGGWVNSRHHTQVEVRGQFSGRSLLSYSHCIALESNSDGQTWWQPHSLTELSQWSTPPFSFVLLVLH